MVESPRALCLLETGLLTTQVFAILREALLAMFSFYRRFKGMTRFRLNTALRALSRLFLCQHLSQTKAQSRRIALRVHDMSV